MAFLDQYTLSQDQTFKERVQAALVYQAVYTANSAASAAYQKQMLAYAQQVLSNPALEAANVACAVASDATIQTDYLSTNPASEANVTDEHIQSVVSNMFQVHAIATY